MWRRELYKQQPALRQRQVREREPRQFCNCNDEPSSFFKKCCSTIFMLFSLTFIIIIAGAPLIIHPGRDDRAPFEIISILESAGASIHRTVMSHLDRTLQDKEKLLEFARMGCIMEYDHFGNEISHCQVQAFVHCLISSARASTECKNASRVLGLFQH